MDTLPVGSLQWWKSKIPGKSRRTSLMRWFRVSISHRILSNLLDQVPLSGRYPARLALEQLYGYMVRNGKEYGVLTTLKGWCFARRENGGQLYVTRMFGDFEARQGISNDAAD